jgi:hypothetical protein
MEDQAHSEVPGRVVGTMHGRGRLIIAVCHGPAGLLTPPTARPRLGGPAISRRSTGGRPNSDDSLHFGAERIGRIDRSIGEPPCARRCRRTEAG